MSGPARTRALALVVDDHPLVRSGMRRTLEAMPELDGVDEAATGEAALAALAARDHALVLLDLALPGISGVEVARRTLERRPGTRIVVVTGDETAPVGPLVRAGISGWLTKGSDVAEIETAVRTALAGGRHLSRDVAQRALLGELDANGPSPFEALSPRELEICRQIDAAVPNRRIARARCTSAKRP